METDLTPTGDRKVADSDKSLVLHTRVIRGSGGGPDKTILNSPRFLTESDYRLLCAFLRHPADEEFSKVTARAREWSAPVVAIDDHGPFDWRVVTRLKQLCAEQRPVIWHAHDYKSNLLGIWLRRSIPMRLITTVHGWGVIDTWRTSLYYALDRFCLRHYDEVLFVSEDLYEQREKLRVSQDNAWLVRNSIDTDEFRRRRSVVVAKRERGFPEDRILIGAVGRLSIEKRFEALIRAIGELVSEGLDVGLWIVGEGREDQRLREVVDEAGLAGRVELLGYRSAMIPIYEAMDVLALTSSREGLPNALLEAMALEIPVVSTRVGGTPNLVHHGENGFLVGVDRQSELLESLRILCNDPDLRKNLGEAGRELILERHSFSRRMESMREIYDHSIERSSE